MALEGRPLSGMSMHSHATESSVAVLLIPGWGQLALRAGLGVWGPGEMAYSVVLVYVRAVFNPSTLCKKPDMTLCTYSSSSVELATGRSLGLTSQPARLLIEPRPH